MNKDLWQPTNLAEMFLTSAEMHADNVALSYKKGHHYESLSYHSLKKEVFCLAQALRGLGFKKGDTAILVSENRPEWVITDLALQLLGCINVPIHEVLSSTQLAIVIDEVKPRAIFFSHETIEQKLLEIVNDISKVDYLFSYHPLNSSDFEHLKYFKDMINEVDLSAEAQADLVKTALAITPEDVASIIYTSGTTGHLKGVPLTHGNFVANILGTLGAIDILPSDKFFSILPLSHVFERTAGYYIPLYSGAAISYCLKLETLSQEIQEQKPTIVLAVPRLYEKIYEKIQAKANKSAVTKLIFKAAFATPKSSPMYPLFDKLVFSKVKGNFGGNIRFFISGGASLPKKIGQFFAKVDMLVLEGYGLTETSPIVAVNEISNNKFGTVGHPLSNLDVKVANDGEIVVKGPSVMSGYLRKEDNKGAFTRDGYFRTGDLGKIDDAGFLSISGRKKDLLVLTTGKKVAPVAIENSLESSLYIDQAMVFGDGRKHIGALIVPNYEKLSQELGINGKSKLAKSPEVYEIIKREAYEKTRNMASIDVVHKFIILSESFTIKNGEMTPKMSLRRHVILERNAEAIENIYK